METLHRLGVLDPRTFWALPVAVQDLHLTHTANHLSGRYQPPVKQRATGIDPRMGAAAESWRAQRSKPPGMREIADAERILSTNGLPESVYVAARETLARLEAV